MTMNNLGYIGPLCRQLKLRRSRNVLSDFGYFRAFCTGLDKVKLHHLTCKHLDPKVCSSFKNTVLTSNFSKSIAFHEIGQSSHNSDHFIYIKYGLLVMFNALCATKDGKFLQYR